MIQKIDPNTDHFKGMRQGPLFESGPITSEPVVMTPMKLPEISPALQSSSFLDMLTHTILGTPDAMLSPEARSKKQGQRGEAGGMAASAAKSPASMARGYMGPQSGGSGDSGIESLGKIVQLLGGIM